MRLKQQSTRGFTLLEVLVALAIVSLTLGSIMTLAGGSKRLAWTAQARLSAILYSRAAISNAQSSRQADYPEYPRTQRKQLEFKKGDLLSKSTRQTKRIFYALERYEVINDGKEITQGLRWVRLKTNR
jgi:prepilin-type N-terminal cleavage/methylation domain-containing protein